VYLVMRNKHKLMKSKLKARFSSVHLWSGWLMYRMQLDRKNNFYVLWHIRVTIVYSLCKLYNYSIQKIKTTFIKTKKLYILSIFNFVAYMFEVISKHIQKCSPYVFCFFVNYTLYNYSIKQLTNSMFQNS
jgi:hypothetical protein